jgi:hypothetical protein
LDLRQHRLGRRREERGCSYLGQDVVAIRLESKQQTVRGEGSAHAEREMKGIDEYGSIGTGEGSETKTPDSRSNRKVRKK